MEQDPSTADDRTPRVDLDPDISGIISCKRSESWTHRRSGKMLLALPSCIIAHVLASNVPVA